ncbi:hypothetical protein V5799_026535 [Amblyomma americanum]|uniref:F-box domain-containing protein n=1 Tax=Amblyomma americanum TaxID=6943 RepID=A0AAQ4DIA7_AMBAM
MTYGEETCTFLSLPNEMIVRILRFLGPVDLMAVERTSRVFSSLVNISYVLQTTKFLPSCSAGFLRYYLNEGRATAISELDLNDFLAADSRTVEGCVHSCVNLKTLRCVNTRLLPTALIRLLQDRLRCLQFLEWSVLESSHHRKDMRKFLLRQPTGNDAAPVIPNTLRGMYIEMAMSGCSVIFLCSLLERGSKLRHFHFHERMLSRRAETAAYLVLECLHVGTAGKFETFTFTDDRAAVAREAEITAAADEWCPVHAPESLLGVFEASLKKSSSVIVRQNPRPSANYVVIDRRTAHLVPKNFLNLFIVIDDDPFATLEVASHYHHWRRNARALTLESSPAQKVARAFSASAADAASFLKFLRGCHNLTELNLASFHFEATVNCCSILADAGLIGLRALALPSCALCWRGRLEQLAGARFCLDELDVRTALTARSQTCAVCMAPSTCNQEMFDYLYMLCPLRRLTLCDLPHVHDLGFLKDCMVMKHVHSLKLESTTKPLDLSFLRGVLKHGSRLRRLCITSIGITVHQWNELLVALCPLFPAAEFIHMHSFDPSLEPGPVAVSAFRATPQEGDDRESHPGPVPSADCVVLCRGRSLISAPRPRNCGPRRF